MDRLVVDGVDGVIGGEIARIVAGQPLRYAGFIQGRLQDEGGEIGLVVAIADEQERSHPGNRA